jgi:hypothetical protein
MSIVRHQDSTTCHEADKRKENDAPDENAGHTGSVGAACSRETKRAHKKAGFPTLPSENSQSSSFSFL